jgi:hypothetical protein
MAINNDIKQPVVAQPTKTADLKTGDATPVAKEKGAEPAKLAADQNAVKAKGAQPGVVESTPASGEKPDLAAGQAAL